MYPSKIITSGEGGFVSTNNDALAEKLKLIRNHGISQSSDVTVLGSNLRLPQMEAAIAYIQMSKLPSFLKVRRRNAGILTDLLSGLNGVTLPTEAKGCSSNWYLYTLALEKNRDKILKYLLSHRVGAAIYYDTPIQKTPFYATKGYDKFILPNTDNASKHVLSLPVHPGVSEDDCVLIASTFRAALESAK
jgi:dTDP-4-amino-4,6-dideoxygalactose transaminase